MEPIDIEVLRRLREYRSSVSLDELTQVFGIPGPEGHGLLCDAVRRLSSQDIRLVEIQQGAVQLTLAGSLLVGSL